MFGREIFPSHRHKALALFQHFLIGKEIRRRAWIIYDDRLSLRQRVASFSLPPLVPFIAHLSLRSCFPSASSIVRAMNSSPAVSSADSPMLPIYARYSRTHTWPRTHVHAYTKKLSLRYFVQIHPKNKSNLSASLFAIRLFSMFFYLFTHREEKVCRWLFSCSEKKCYRACL